MKNRLDDLGTWLFWKKILVAFVIGFLPPFIYGLIDLLDQFADGANDFEFMSTLLVSLLLAATTAGLRGVLALFTNFLPTDALHGFKQNRPNEVVVSRKGKIAEEPPDTIAVVPEPEPPPIPESLPEPEPEPLPEMEPEPEEPPPPRPKSRKRKPRR